MKNIGRSNRSLVFSILLSSVVTLSGVSGAQNPPSRPILFAHGYCGSAFDFQPSLTALNQQLPSSLYPDPTVYYVYYDSALKTTTFAIEAGGILIPVNQSSILASTRFFDMVFYDPVAKSVDSTNVSKISVLNKANELAQVIKQITAITKTTKVIVVAHSMGGLDARAYVENMASTGECYNYTKNMPDYTVSTCKPGSSGYAGNVGDIITIDTPHLGSPLAALSLNAPSCIVAPSVNHSELELLPGGSGLIEALNYSGTPIAGIKPRKNSTPIQAVEDYFDDITVSWDDVNGWSDDVVQQGSLSIVLNLPAKNSSALLQDVPINYSSSDEGIINTPACWYPVPLLGSEPILHFMTCLGAQPRTQAAIASQIVSNASTTVTSSAATLITASGAKLNGSINPQGANGYAGFYWGTDPTLTVYNIACSDSNNIGSWSYCPAVTANFAAQSFGSSLSNLPSNTTFYFRMVFYDTSNGSSPLGPILSFKTP